MTREDLIILCRADFSNKIRNNRIKEQCEICGEIENLVLHHIKSFADLFDLCCKELSIDIYKEEFTEIEVINIREKMIAKQLSSEVKTVCNECHKVIHEKGYNYARTERKPKSDTKVRIKPSEDLELYLESLIGERLYKEQQLELIEKINLRDSRNRLQKLVSKMNKGLEMLGLNYIIISKIEDRVIDGKRVKKTYWIVNKTEQ